MPWTTTQLDAAVRRFAFIPDGDPDYTAAVILAMANECVLDTFVPAITAVQENFFVATSDVAITASQQGYRIPTRAALGRVREVSRIDSSSVGHDLPMIPLEDVDQYASTTGVPVVFAVSGDKILLCPTPSATTGTLRIRYQRRPGSLVVTTSAQQITAIDAGRVKLTIGTHSYATTSVVDVVQQDPGFETLGQSLTPSATDATSITFAAAVDDDVALGDWVSIATQTPIPQIPAECHAILARAVAAEILEQLGDQRHQAAYAKMRQKLDSVLTVMAPRVDGESPKIVNQHSPLRQGFQARKAWYQAS